MKMKFDKEKMAQKFSDVTKGIQKTSGQAMEKAKDISGNVAGKAKELTVKSKNTVVTAIDANGDGKIDIEDIIILGLKTPGVAIDRKGF